MTKMRKVDFWLSNTFSQNLLVWLGLFLFLLNATPKVNNVLISLGIIVAIAPCVYINNLFILPYFKGNRRKFFFLFLLNVLCYASLITVILNLIVDQGFEWFLYLNLIGTFFISMVFASSIKMAKDNYINKQKEKETQLALLKAQINPHFLFNTLNNLYGLSVSKSEQLPDLMLKLSDLLRYSLYETTSKYVRLEKEIDYIENYMALEQIRLDEKTEITFTKKLKNKDSKIIPMLLIVFVENAFKHLTTHEKESFVNVDIEETDRDINFTCANSFETKQIKISQIERKNNGIGLENIKKRLDYIYSNTYTLDINIHEHIYHVKLQLPKVI